MRLFAKEERMFENMATKAINKKKAEIRKKRKESGLATRSTRISLGDAISGQFKQIKRAMAQEAKREEALTMSLQRRAMSLVKEAEIKLEKGDYHGALATIEKFKARKRVDMIHISDLERRANRMWEKEVIFFPSTDERARNYVG